MRACSLYVIIFLFCSNVNSGYSDDIKASFEIIVDHCYTQPCENNGSCTLENDSYKCNCVAPFTGINCEITPCVPNPCGNNGFCYETKNSYRCECKESFHGNDCKESISTTRETTEPTTQIDETTPLSSLETTTSVSTESISTTRETTETTTQIDDTTQLFSSESTTSSYESLSTTTETTESTTHIDATTPLSSLESTTSVSTESTSIPSKTTESTRHVDEASPFTPSSLLESTPSISTSVKSGEMESTVSSNTESPSTTVDNGVNIETMHSNQVVIYASSTSAAFLVIISIAIAAVLYSRRLKKTKRSRGFQSIDSTSMGSENSASAMI